MTDNIDIIGWLIDNNHKYHDDHHYLSWEKCDSPDCRIARAYEEDRANKLIMALRAKAILEG